MALVRRRGEAAWHGMAWHGHLRQAITSQAVPVGPASRSSPAPTRLPDGKCIGRPDHRQKGGGWATAPAGRLASWRGRQGAGGHHSRKQAGILARRPDQQHRTRSSVIHLASHGSVGLQMRGACRARVCKKALDDEYGPLHASLFGRGAQKYTACGPPSLMPASQP